MRNTIFFLLLVVLFTVSTVKSQVSRPDQGKGQGVVFKIPDDVFPMDWKKSGFKGLLMLRKDLPSGLFIAYPDDAESLDQLRERAAKFLFPMFMGGSTGLENIPPTISPVPVHKNDVDASGKYYLYSKEKTQVQIIFYERISNGRSFLYGYFANKNIDSKDKGAIEGWANEKGQGIKIFEEFWRSFKD